MKKYQILKTQEFESWFKAQQPKVRVIIGARLDLLAIGHFGNHKRFERLIELRWQNGTRVYAFEWNPGTIVVAVGGNKNAQSRDIKKAKKIRHQILSGS